MDDHDNYQYVCPFEWLTSPSSLDDLIVTALNAASTNRRSVTSQPRARAAGREVRRVLHIGSGSSILGEHLLENEDLFGVDYVVNVDRDVETMARMQNRWEDRADAMGIDSSRLDFAVVDFCVENIGYPSGSFDLVIDKSTLDCTLCSDQATSKLLMEVYRLLSDSGVYVLVSFHDIELLLPLLQDCPGTSWIVSHSSLKRQVEDLGGSILSKNHEPRSVSFTPVDSTEETDDARKRRYVNVITCIRNGTSLPEQLSFEMINQHVHAVNDTWYQLRNPLLTSRRKNELAAAFLNGVEECSLSIPQSYKVLFTDAEREHLTYDLFLEDWKAYLAAHEDLPSDSMSNATALAFLEEMQ